jgi:hypothetical protein
MVNSFWLLWSPSALFRGPLCFAPLPLPHPPQHRVEDGPLFDASPAKWPSGDAQNFLDVGLPSDAMPEGLPSHGQCTDARVSLSIWLGSCSRCPRRVKPFHQIRPTRVHVMLCAETVIVIPSARDAPPLSPPAGKLLLVSALAVLPRLRLRACRCAPRRQPHLDQMHAVACCSRSKPPCHG